MTATDVKTVWAIDPMHSEIQFKVRHMMISTVTGQFNQFEGQLESGTDEENNFDGASISFTADVSSISTNNEHRDTHLKSDDFFNAEAFPKLTFKSTSFTKLGANEYKLTGDITIREVTKSIELDVNYFGTMVDPYGNTKAGFEINGEINRKDFGLKWSAVTEAGGVVVSDDVKLHLNVQVAKQ